MAAVVRCGGRVGGIWGAAPRFGPRSSSRTALPRRFCPKTNNGVVRPTQAGRAAYGPPPPPASIQKITLSARRPPSRAHEHATVRDLVRVRAHPPHPTNGHKAEDADRWGTRKLGRRPGNGAPLRARAPSFSLPCERGLNSHTDVATRPHLSLAL